MGRDTQALSQQRGSQDTYSVTTWLETSPNEKQLGPGSGAVGIGHLSPAHGQDTENYGEVGWEALDKTQLQSLGFLLHTPANCSSWVISRVPVSTATLKTNVRLEDRIGS